MALNTSRGKGSPTLVSSCPCSHGSQGCSGREEDCYRKSFPCPHSKGSTSFEDGGRMEKGRVPSAPLPPGECPGCRILPASLPYPQRCRAPLLSPLFSSGWRLQLFMPPVADSLCTLGCCRRLSNQRWLGSSSRLPGLPAPAQDTESRSVSSWCSRGGEALSCVVFKRYCLTVTRAAAEGLKAGGSSAPAPQGAALLLSRTPR